MTIDDAEFAQDTLITPEEFCRLWREQLIEAVERTVRKRLDAAFEGLAEEMAEAIAESIAKEPTHAPE